MALKMTKEIISLVADRIESIDYNTPENAMDTIKIDDCTLIIYPHSSGPYSIEKLVNGVLVRKLAVILEEQSEELSSMTSSQFVEQFLKIKKKKPEIKNPEPKAS